MVNSRCRRFKRGIFGRFVRDGEGVALVEAAIVTPFFMLLLIMVMEASLVFFAETTLDNATSVAARQIRTGQAKSQAMTAENFRQLIHDSTYLMAKDKISINVQSFDDWNDFFQNRDRDAPDEDSIESNFNSGTPLSVMYVRVFYEWPLILPDIGGLLSGARNPFRTGVSGNRRIETSMIFRNEPYPQ